MILTNIQNRGANSINLDVTGLKLHKPLPCLRNPLKAEGAKDLHQKKVKNYRRNRYKSLNYLKFNS